jgi:hypothetical protein
MLDLDVMLCCNNMCSVVISSHKYLLAIEDTLIECLEIGFEIANLSLIARESCRSRRRGCHAVVTLTISTSNWTVLPASGLL